MQRRYNTVELTHQTIENSITNARITLQLFEVTNLDEEKKLNQETRRSATKSALRSLKSKEPHVFPGAGSV